MVRRLWQDINDAARQAGLENGLDFHNVSSVNPGGYHLGSVTGATADGRLEGQPFAIGNSPTGFDANGLTALMNSVCAPGAANSGAITNFKLSREMLHGERLKCETLFHAYFQKGGLQANIAVVSKQDMEAALETSGFAPTGDFARLMPVTGLFLYDFKENDPKRHAEYTGVPPKLALDNLALLNSAGADIILRCPIIPGLTDREDHFAAIAALSMKHAHILEVNVMPYHPMGKSKAHAIGREYPLPDIDFPAKGQADKWVDTIQRQTDKPVKTG